MTEDYIITLHRRKIVLFIWLLMLNITDIRFDKYLLYYKELDSNEI